MTISSGRLTFLSLRSLLAAAALLSCAGCASSNGTGQASITASTLSATATTSTAPVVTAAPTAPAGFDTITTADGRVRSYLVSDLSNGESAPLLFVLHGFGGNAQAMSSSTNIEDSLDAYDLDAVVVYPNGTGAEQGLPQSWNAGTCCPFAMFDLVDDVAFFDELITSLIAQYHIDTERVWVVGHSNGGMMAYRLGCELSTRITAIGVAAGALMIDTCAPLRPVNALHVHGELDTVVPLAGSSSFLGIVFPSTQLSVEKFSRTNGGDIKLVTDAKWSHDWQPEWSELFIKFLASK